MSKRSRVLLVDGHPDGAPARLCHAMADAYAAEARNAGATVRLKRLAEMDFPFLQTVAEFEAPPDNAAIVELRQDIQWADHLVFVFPMWLGSAPAKLRGLMEQVARGGYFAETSAGGWKPHLRGKSARLIVTMGMPAFVYRAVFGAHGVRSWAASILGFAGAKPVRLTLLGGVSSESAVHCLQRARALGHEIK